MYYTLKVTIEAGNVEEAVDKLFKGEIHNIRHQPHTHKHIRTSETSSKEAETEFYKKYIKNRLNGGENDE